MGVVCLSLVSFLGVVRSYGGDIPLNFHEALSDARASAKLS